MDRYDQAINYLKSLPPDVYPDVVENSWFSAGSDPELIAGCLFQFAAPSNSTNDNCGCLVMIKENPLHYRACTEKLTNEIVADTRIPNDYRQITIESLPAFAEWQRRLDREVRGIHFRYPEDDDEEEYDDEEDLIEAANELLEAAELVEV